MPSVQATAAIAMAKLNVITGDRDYAKAANDLIAGASTAGAAAMVGSVGTLGLALEYRAQPDAVIAIAGAASDERSGALWKTALATYRPGKVVTRIEPERARAATVPAAAQAMFAASKGRNSPLAFVCAGTACAPPTDNSAKLADLIKTFEIGADAKTAVANDNKAGNTPPM